MAEQGKPLAGRRILVVEDDFLVGLALSSLLEECGASVVGPIGFAHEALAVIESGNEPVDGAVLDIDLHGEKSYAIADALASRHVRFVFATGYGVDAIDERYRAYPRCQKPFEERALLGALASGLVDR